MMFSFLAPLFLGGALFLTLPWLLHQIRRPEREPVVFSSLMFVPNIKKEVIERRRIQHILLMLLRMLILLLLVMAFARPSWQSNVAIETPDATSWNVILFDQSYSLQANNHFELAKNQAIELVDSFSSDDQVGLIVFDHRPEVIAPLWSSNPGNQHSINDIKQIIAELEPSNQTTDFLSALQLAQNEFSILENDNSQAFGNWVIHVISDFQENGVINSRIDWRLPERYQLELYPVGDEQVNNVAITDHVVRETKSGELQLVTKVNNSIGGLDQEITATLFIAEEEIHSSTLRITPGNSTQLSFWLPQTQHSQVHGWIDLPQDDLSIDNKRYFVWNPPTKTPIQLISDEDAAKPRTSAWFLSHAIPQTLDLPWEVQYTTSLAADLQNEQDLILMVDLHNPDPPFLSAVLEHVTQGGNLLVILNDTWVSDQSNEYFFNLLGFHANGLKRGLRQQNEFDLLSWIDFNHQVFASFKGAQYNDFSNLIFYDYIEIELLDDSAIKPLARYDAHDQPAGDVAIFETNHGEGNVMVWTFSPNLQQNNLVRSTKFIPILHESLNYLSNQQQMKLEYIIGESLRLPDMVEDATSNLQVKIPEQANPIVGGSIGTIQTDELTALPWIDTPGIVQWENSEGRVLQLQSVNIDTKESQLKRISLEDFRFKFSSAPMIQQADPDAPNQLTAELNQTQKNTEYGSWVLGLLFVFFVTEMVYATRLN